MMQIKESNLSSHLHQNTSNALLKKASTKQSKTPDSIDEALVKIKMEGIKTLMTGKAALKLEELNRQKVTSKVLEKTLETLKQADKNRDGKVTVEELKEHINKKSKKRDVPIDIKDKNRDGKVSVKEKEEALKKDKPLDVDDKNRDGKVSQKEKEDAKEAKQKKTLGMVKEIIGELKKDDDFKEIHPSQFKGISKMINNELIDSKDAQRLNKFLNT